MWGVIVQMSHRLVDWINNMSQTLNATEMSLEDLFTNKYNFKIPHYQRPYAWGEEESLQLLSDIQGALERDSDESYFLGSIVLIKDPAKPDSEVIDGQQRLTSLTLLLAIMRDLVVKTSLRDSIHKFIEEPPLEWNNEPAYPRLTIRPRDNEFFHDHVQTSGRTHSLLQIGDDAVETEAQRALRDNARALYEELESWSQEELTDLFKMLSKRTVLVVITTPNFDSAYRIFSVLNSRGVPLTPADIFKSQVIGAIPDKDKDHYTDIWERYEESLGRDGFGKLFHYIRTIYSQEKPAKNLIQEFPEKVLDPYIKAGNGIGFMEEVLIPYAHAAEHLMTQKSQGNAEWESINSWIHQLNLVPNNEWRPAVLWAFKAYEGDKDFLNYFLKKLERFVAGLLIRRIHSNYRAAKYAELLRQLLNGDGLEAKAFDLSAEEKQEMMKQLNTEIYLQPQYICRYILMRLNSLAAGHYEVSNNKKIAIEHVLPQHPDPDSGWSQNFTEPAVEYWTNRLGNLLPLNRKKRRTEAQGFEFEKKKEVYFGSIVSDSIIFTLTEQVINETEWTPTVVEARHRHMLNTLYDVWSLK